MMRHFVRDPALRFDTAPLAVRLQCHPELWNEHRGRTESASSPHHQVDDIWLRCRSQEELQSGVRRVDEHHPVWYPAFFVLPELRPIIGAARNRFDAWEVGGCLITRIPPGGEVKPHADGGWHPNYYRTKIYIPIEANDKCLNYCEDEAVIMRQGDVWFFDNTKAHSVVNKGETDRITLIVSLRCE